MEIDTFRPVFFSYLFNPLFCIFFSAYSLCSFFGLLTFANFDLLYTSHLASHLLFVLLVSITMYTDMATFLISRRYTLFFIPIGWMLAHIHQLPLTGIESITGSILGITLLWSVNAVGKYFKKQDVLGQGDVDFIGLIGAFTGLRGCWFALLFGSWVVLFYFAMLAFSYCLFGRFFKKSVLLYPSAIPFGLFLGYGALLYEIITVTYSTSLVGTFCFNFPFN